MPFSSADHHRAAVDPPNGSSDSEPEAEMDEDEEEEYEEIEEEIEVEEEVEEEVEVDDDDGDEEEDDEIGEDLSDAPVDEDREDISQVMKSMGNEERLRPVSSNSDQSIANIPPAILAVEGNTTQSKFFGPSEIKANEKPHVLGGDPKYPKDGLDPVSCEDNGPQEASARKNFSGLTSPEKGTPKDSADVNYNSGSRLWDSGISKVETAKRLSNTGKEVASTVSIRDGCEGDNDFLYSEKEAKQLGMTSGEDMKPRTSSVTQIRIQSLSPAAERKDGNKRPAIICDFFAKGWCIKGNSCRFLHVKDHVDVTSQKSELEADKGLPLHTDKSRSISPLKDVGRGPPRQTWRADDNDHYASSIAKGSSPLYRNSLFPEQGSFSNTSVMLSDTYRGIDNPSHATSVEEHRRSQSWTRSSLSLSSSNIDPLASQKVLEREREYRASISASLLRSSSPFSGSEAEKLSLKNTSVLDTKSSSNNWEPSVPFRPSFFSTTRTVSSPGSQYDPLRDSIEQSNLEGRFPKFSSSIQGTSIPGTEWRKNADPVFSRPNNSSEKRPIASHVSEQQKRSAFSKEEKLLSPVHVKDVTKSSKFYSDIGFQNDGLRHKNELKVEMGRINNEMDVDLKTDEDALKESKALKYFRAALIEFVKELVKPTWLEGQLSKDAHKLIVKKAVDKVLSTLQENQIPITADQIKHYLSLSKSKLSKLVEGYVEKYGKL